MNKMNPFRLRSKALILGLVLSLLSISPVQAEKIVLSKNGVLVPEYDKILYLLGIALEGNLICFERTCFNLGKLLGSGNTTLVFELADDTGNVIRIPRARSDSAFIDATIRGSRLLFLEGVPHTEIRSFKEGRYAIVERHPEGAVSLPQAIADANENANLRADLERALIRFAKSTALFKKIGDFRLDQLTYDPRARLVILTDWTAWHSYAQLVSDPVLFESELFEELESSDSDWIPLLAKILRRSTLDKRRNLHKQGRLRSHFSCLSELTSS